MRAREPGDAAGRGRGGTDAPAGGPAAGIVLGPERVLELLPQQRPFRFIDEILELDGEHIVARHRFDPEAFFYRGHFPDNPVTPGVILLESMAQISVVALGIHMMALEGGLEVVENHIALFTDAEVEFGGLVKPGERVTVRARKQFFRRMKIRSEAEMTLDDGTLVLSGNVSGMAVPR